MSGGKLLADLRDQTKDAASRLAAFDKVFEKLDPKHQQYLRLLEENGCRTGKAMEEMGYSRYAVSGWRKRYPLFAQCERMLKEDFTAEILEKERLTIRHDQIAQAGLEKVPILHQGIDTGFKEYANLNVAEKANALLLRQGGHLKDEQPGAPTIGPAFIVKVVNQIGETVQETTIGVMPNLPSPATEEDWIDV